MNDMQSVIQPKSDQLNADSLLSGPITITITKVEIRPGTEQPISIHYEGENGRPYKCCKSMARVLVHCWGADANNYVGRSLTLYCDPKVTWGGMAVGGIRISHISHVDAVMTMALTVTKGNKKPFTVKPLPAQTATPKTTTDAPPLVQRVEKAIANLQATEPTLDRFTKAERACASLLADLDAAGETAVRDNLIAELARLRSACDDKMGE